MSEIKSFRDEFGFLSNFYSVKIEFEGETYQNAEAAFQATKTMDSLERKKFEKLTGKEAKKLGKKVKLRNDWETVKEEKMYKILKVKFENPELRRLLLATGNQVIAEHNYWGDTEWGVCNGAGQNKLGNLLMLVRENLK